MKIENRFTIDAPIEQAWALLTNIAEIAPCLPGASLSGEDGGVYSGTVRIKVGPVTAEYRGTAEFVERDDHNHHAVIDGKGRDARGAGNAQALITATMRNLGEQTEVAISTDLKITGKVAQFGRGVMQDVSEKLLGQFAMCLATKLEAATPLDAIAVASASTERTSAATTSTATAAADSAAFASGSIHGTAEAPDETLDLLGVAGGAVLKRLLPVAMAGIILVVILVVVLG